MMFERYTERARQVVALAQEEARKSKAGYTGAPHILLGLLREEEGLAARVLAHLGVTIEKVREDIDKLGLGALTREDDSAPLTPRAEKIMQNALREALGLGHNHIGTEHVLLGLLREGDNSALEVLEGYATVEKIRAEVIRMLSGPTAPILKQPRTLHERDTRELSPGLKESKLLETMIDLGVTLGRQFPDRPASVITKAVLALHG